MSLIQMVLAGIIVGNVFFWLGVYFEYRIHNPKIKK